MKRFALIVCALTAFSGFLLWNTLTGSAPEVGSDVSRPLGKNEMTSGDVSTRTLPPLDATDEKPDVRSAAPTPLHTVSTRDAVKIASQTAPDGTTHELCTSPLGAGVYYRRGSSSLHRVDRWARPEDSARLALGRTGEVYAAYEDRPNGEVRFAWIAAPDHEIDPDKPWVHIGTVSEASRLHLSTSEAGVLLSIFDPGEESGDDLSEDLAEARLFYAFWNSRTASWHRGTAHRGDTFTAVTGQPGAFVLQP